MSASSGESKLVQRVLQGGLGVACALLVMGMVLNMTQHRDEPTRAVRLFDLARPLDAGALLQACGVLVLAMTPVARVLVLLVAWIRERRLRYAAAAAIVLLTLAAAVLAGR